VHRNLTSFLNAFIVQLSHGNRSVAALFDYSRIASVAKMRAIAIEVSTWRGMYVSACPLATSVSLAKRLNRSRCCFGSILALAQGIALELVCIVGPIISVVVTTVQITLINANDIVHTETVIGIAAGFVLLLLILVALVIIIIYLCR